MKTAKKQILTNGGFYNIIAALVTYQYSQTTSLIHNSGYFT